MKMHFIVFLLIVKTVACAKILCVFPSPLYSHQSVFQPIWQELSLRGHQVTVITTNPVKNASLTNLKEIDLSFSYKLVFEEYRMQDVINTESSLPVLMKHMFYVVQNMTVEQLRRPEVRDLIEGNDEFDLMIAEAHIPAWFGLAKKYRCPLIAITSMHAANHFNRYLGNFNHPILTHNTNLPFDKELPFFRRIVCVLFEVLDVFLIKYTSYLPQERIIREVLNDTEIDLVRMARNISVLFTNIIPGFNRATTAIPSIVQLNGLHIRPPRPLPQELRDVLDGASQGAIYFSLGSNVKSYLLSKEKQSILLEAFSELPYTVVWKFEDEVANLPRNVRTLKWAPQQDILRHKNTKLFISQGGIQSIDEAIRFRVPVLGLPFFGDHFYNVFRVRDLGLGTWLDFKTISKEGLKNAILESINNDTYSKNLEEMSDLLHQPPKALEKAISWIEYVLRHRGAYHLRSPLADIPFYQYYLFDVIFVLAVVCSLFVYILSKLIRITWKFWYNLRSKKIKIL